MSRLDHVLRVGHAKKQLASLGYKGPDQKYVEFEILPHESFEERDCIRVPWFLYKTQDVKMRKFYDFETKTTTTRRDAWLKHRQPQLAYYVADVLADARLGDEAVPQEYPTNSDEVQSYALAEYLRKRGTTSVDVVPTFVLEYVNSHYCLVPADAMSLLERLQRARHHLIEYMTEQNMDSRDKVWKDWYVAKLDKLIKYERSL